MNPITVLLVDDHRFVRDGLLAMLKLEADIEVVGEAKNGRQAVALARTLCPAVIVMDIAMPLLNGLEATRQILQANPAVRVLILSAHSEDAYIEHAMAMGAAGYMIKQTAQHGLAGAIREVCKGRTFLSPSISNRRCDHQRMAKAMGALPTKNPDPHFTPREMEVLQLIAAGKDNKATAHALKISIKTVEKHLRRVMETLNIHDPAGLTRYAITSGIIESSVQVTIL